MSRKLDDDFLIRVNKQRGALFRCPGAYVDGTSFRCGQRTVERGARADFREHYPLVYRTAYSVTRSTQHAEDIVQSLFVQLLRLGSPRGPREKPKAYLYREPSKVKVETIVIDKIHKPTEN